MSRPNCSSAATLVFGSMQPNHQLDRFLLLRWLNAKAVCGNNRQSKARN
jgi:hypothetical protein